MSTRDINRSASASREARREGDRVPFWSSKFHRFHQGIRLASRPSSKATRILDSLRAQGVVTGRSLTANVRRYFDKSDEDE